MVQEKINATSKLRNQNKIMQTALKASRAAEKKLHEKWQLAVKAIATEKKLMAKKLEKAREEAFSKAHESMEAVRAKKEELKKKVIDKALVFFEKSYAKKISKSKIAKRKKASSIEKVVKSTSKKTRVNVGSEEIGTKKRGRPAKEKIADS